MDAENLERFVVSHCPVDEKNVVTQTFRHKGLAFAYAKRRLPFNHCSAIVVEQQVGGGPMKASVQDPRTGLFWANLNRWVFHSNGDIEHIRL